ncbi:MAG: nuclear transport factor 2 family protein [Candidatus Puniceispirillaceae bacterium]
MHDSLDQAKAIVLNWQKSIDSANISALPAILSSYVSDSYLWRGMHPFHEQHGADSVCSAFYVPLKTAFSALRRRQDIFFAGRNEIDGFNSVWVASMGHFIGLFDQPFAGIAPNQKLIMLRYAEFHKIEHNKITETALFIDLLHLMAQTGLWPIAEQTGIHLVQPGPATHDGLLFDSQDAATGTATLALINRMIGDINQGQYATPQEELGQCWHDDMIWWGPTGIGASYTIERYIQQHQRPFRTQNEGRRFNGHICRMAEGNYGGFFGWPNLSLKPTGGYLGMTPFDGYADMRVVDMYRRDGDKLAENWIFIDLLHFLNMQGHDILSQISRTG